MSDARPAVPPQVCDCGLESIQGTTATRGGIHADGCNSTVPPQGVPLDEIESAAGLCQSEANRRISQKTSEHWERVAVVLRGFVLAERVRAEAQEPSPVSGLSAEWQPIETAPKDEDSILLYSERDGVQAGYWDVDAWLSVETQHLTGGRMEATHWMPLPKPPRALADAEPSPSTKERT